MSLRIFLAAPFALALALPAQVKPPEAQNPLGQQPTEATQEPVKAKTSAEVIDALQAEKARLEREIRYAKERAADAKRLLSEKLRPQEQTFRVIDAGQATAPQVATAPRVQRRFARIATAAEMETQPEGTLLVVNGRAISESYVNRVMDYMREAQPEGDESLRAQRVLFDLIRIEAIAGKFEENDGETKLAECVGELDGGKTVADLAKTVGTVQGADENGMVQVTRNSMHGPFFEFTAFSTPVGERARPFRNATGYVVLHVDSLEKGETPMLDKAVCHAVQVPYTQDDAKLKQAQFEVNSGQIDILVRDQQVLDRLPALFKPAAAQPRMDTAQLEQQLTQLEQQLRKLEGSGGDSQDAIKAVQARIEQVKNMLKAAKAPTDADHDGDEAAGAPVEAPGGKKGEAEVEKKDGR